MKIRDIIVLAFETLMVSKFRSFLSVLGVTIGVAAVIAGVILGVGNRETIMQKLAESGSDILFFYTKPKAEEFLRPARLRYEADLSISEKDIQYIKRQCSAIKEMTPYLIIPAALRYGGKYHIIKAAGFASPGPFRDIFRIKIDKGRFLSELDVKSKEKVCVIEKTEFSDEIFGGEVPLGKFILIGRDKYKIVGTVKKMIFPFGYPRRLIVLFPSTSLQETFGLKNYTTVELRAKKVEDVFKARYQLEQAIAQRFGYPPKYYISEYARYVEIALEVASLLTIITIGIAVISLTVGGVGIMNVMMTMVVEQTRSIGIAKAIGAKRNSILLLFIAESTILTLMGGIVGIAVGLGLSKFVTSAIGLPFIVPPWAIFLGFFLSVAVGIVSGSYPAKRAAELDPVVALRQL